jgi:hypothetical protein
MIFVEWDDKMIFKMEVSEFSYTEDMFDSSLTINVKPNEYKKEITNYVNFWSDQRKTQDLIIYFNGESKMGTRFFILKSGIPSKVIISNSGFLTSCTFKFKSMKEISRPLKINEILNHEDTTSFVNKNSN